MWLAYCNSLLEVTCKKASVHPTKLRLLKIDYYKVYQGNNHYCYNDLS